MQTARMTILMTPDYKAEIARRAASRGVSSSEYIRDAVDRMDHAADVDGAELAALVAQVNEALPRMRGALERSSRTLDELHGEMDAFLREKGMRG